MPGNRFLDTVAHKISLGSSGQVLTVDDSADAGVKFADPPSSTDASALTSGTLPAARLPGVLANVDTQAELLSAAGAAAESHTHAASAITSGTVDTARLGSGTANSGTFLRGDQTWQPVATALSPSTKTTAYTTTSSDNYIRCNHASTPFTITLHAATGSGQQLIIKNIGAATVTVDGNSAETIDGAATITLAQYSSVTLIDAASGAWDIA